MGDPKMCCRLEKRTLVQNEAMNNFVPIHLLLKTILMVRLNSTNQKLRHTF